MRTNIRIGEPVHYTPRPIGQRGSDALFDLTMYGVDRFFHERTHHRPSQAMMEALEDIPRTVSSTVSRPSPSQRCVDQTRSQERPSGLQPAGG